MENTMTDAVIFTAATAVILILVFTVIYAWLVINDLRREISKLDKRLKTEHTRSYMAGDISHAYMRQQQIFAVEKFLATCREDGHLKKSEPEPTQPLNLCFNHQQETNHSHYATENCDYCKALKENS